jgi:hypothetical protein
VKKLLPFILLIAGVLLTTCEERERSNPIDPNADPDAWAPSNLQVQVIDDSQIKLTWTQEEERISGFRIGRKEGNGSFSQIAEVEKDVTEYTDTGLSYGTDYTYRVQAFTDANVSQYIEITIYIPQPTLTITSPNGGEIWILGSTHDITWTSTGDIGNVMIKLYRDGYSYLPIVDVPGTENDGSYTWDILSSWAESSTYIIKIYSNIPYEFLDESDNYFSISYSTGLVFQDDFSGTLEWDTGSYGSYQIVNGRLRISSGGDQDYQHTAYMDISVATGYSYVEPELEYIVDVEFDSGDEHQPYGIGLHSPSGNRYYFMITNYGQYKLSRYLDSWITLIDYTFSSSISDAGGDGELKLTYDDYQFNLYFNGEYLNSYSLNGKRFSGIYLYQQENTVIDFDNVKLYGTLTD